MGGLISFLLTKRLETLSAGRCDCVGNALSGLALPSQAIVMTIMAEILNQVMLSILCNTQGQGNTTGTFQALKRIFFVNHFNVRSDLICIELKAF